METLGGLVGGFESVLTPQTLLFALVGVIIGQVVGVLPGLGPGAAIAMLLPLTFRLDAATSIVMLGGIYYGTMYGGSITSILLRVPGEAQSAVTCLDGYEMARQGRAGAALGIAAFGSFIAGTLGVVGLLLMAPPLARLALSFGPPEQFALMVLAISLVSYFGSASLSKALTIAACGLALGTVGRDLMTATPRFTLGFLELEDGIGLVPMVMGLWGLAEVFNMLERGPTGEVPVLGYGRLRDLLPTRQDWRDSAAPIARGTVSGFLIGVIPGGTATLASFVSYATELKFARNRAKLGHGAIEGVAGPESANNAAAAGAFVPLLTLGIPGNPSMALLLGALILHGVVPGPLLLRDHPDVFWTVVASMYIGNAFLLALNLPLIGLFVKALQLPRWSLVGAIVLFCLIGAYGVNNNPFEIYTLAFFGVLGYLLPKAGYNVIPLVLGVILGPTMETALRQSIMMSQGRGVEFFTDRLLMLGLLGMAALVLATGLLAKRPPVGAQLASSGNHLGT